MVQPQFQVGGGTLAGSRVTPQEVKDFFKAIVIANGSGGKAHMEALWQEYKTLTNKSEDLKKQGSTGMLSETEMKRWDMLEHQMHKIVDSTFPLMQNAEATGQDYLNFIDKNRAYLSKAIPDLAKYETFFANNRGVKFDGPSCMVVSAVLD